MFLALHFFRKDSRRFWWAIALSQTLLAGLIGVDCLRDDAMPGALEGWASILVPAFWAVLIAMAVQEDSTIGRTQFWLTTPCRWSSLLGAKLLFAVCWVHLPYLAGCWAVIQARGFQPWRFIPNLLEKQLLVLCTVTLPAIALASILRNLSQFAVCLLAAGGVAASLMPWLVSTMEARMMGDTLRPVFVVATVAAGSAVVVLIEYRSRRTLLSRSLGVAAAAAAVVLAMLWPREASALIRGALETRRSEPIAVRMPTAPDASSAPRNYYAFRGSPGSRVQILLPAEVTGISSSDVAVLKQLDFSIVSAGGERFDSEPFYKLDRTRLPNVIAAFAYVFDRRMPAWQIIDADTRTFERLSRGPVRIEARLQAVNHRREPSTWLDLNQGAAVPGLGRCFSDERGGFDGRRALAVVCESPDPGSLLTEVRLYQPKGGLDLTHQLGDARSFAPWPTRTWLSPVNRSQTYFHITDTSATAAGNLWLAERTRLPGAKIAITPVIRTSSSVVRYEAAGVNLSRYAKKAGN